MSGYVGGPDPRDGPPNPLERIAELETKLEETVSLRDFEALEAKMAEREADVAKLVGLLKEGSGLVMESSLSDVTLRTQITALTVALLNYGGHTKTCQGRSAESCDCRWIDAVLVAKRMQSE